MALTVTARVDGQSGNKRTSSGQVSLDSSYPSGGYPVTARTFGLGVLDPGGLIFAPSTGLDLEYDSTNGTVRVYQFGAREVPTGFNLSAITGVSFQATGV